MPRRNLFLLSAIALVSLACYKKADSAYRSHYGQMVATIVTVFEEIDRNYVREVDERQIFEGAIKGMVDRLDDPYSGYEPPQEAQAFQQSLDQKFGGIGIELGIDPTTKRLTVMSPMIGTPAYTSGVLAGDQLLAIDGEDTMGFDMDDALRRLRGKPGQKVHLTVLHAGQATEVEIELRRDVINVPSVLGDWRDAQGQWKFVLARDPTIGYLRVTTFGEQTVRELRSALEELSRSGIQALVVDLRDNSGGYLSAAIDTCDFFVKEGEIVSIRGRETQPVEAIPGGPVDGDQVPGEKVPGEKVPATAAPRFKNEQRRLASGNAVYTAWPIVILINRHSASASEIVAACLQDHQRALVVGERTWGKGTVQNVIKLEGGKSALRLTIASFWRPSDKNIHRFADAKESDEWGVRPNPGFEVKLTDDEQKKLFEDRRTRDVIQKPGAADPAASTPGFDPQLDKAVEVLRDRLSGPPSG
ncbi:MAG TPA: S41 family peptidase [Pirellulales bacterium]|nr:S41 family peptidase [Pirellulales bacterium]